MSSLSRFSATNSKEIESLKKRISEWKYNQKRIQLVKSFKKWAEAQEMDQKLENYEVGALDKTLENNEVNLTFGVVWQNT